MKGNSAGLGISAREGRALTIIVLPWVEAIARLLYLFYLERVVLRTVRGALQGGRDCSKLKPN